MYAYIDMEFMLSGELTKRWRSAGHAPTVWSSIDPTRLCIRRSPSHRRGTLKGVPTVKPPNNHF